MIQCPKCGLEKQEDTHSPHMCIDCAKAENSRVTYYRQNQDEWLAVAKDAGLDIWLQQPGETQWEYTVWSAYRDSYPGKKPSYGSVAKQLGTTYDAVRKIASRWTFNVRMQVWMREVDSITMVQRRAEILDMNKEHVDMAGKLRAKLNTAIDLIDEYSLKPSEIASLAKMATDLERKARIDIVDQEKLRSAEASDSENPDVKKEPTKQADLAEVIKILAAAGALGNLANIGLRTTTEMSLVDKTGNRVVLEDERE